MAAMHEERRRLHAVAHLAAIAAALQRERHILLRLLLQANGIAGPDHAFAQHARIEPAPARMHLLRDALEFAVAEIRPQVRAWRGVRGELEAQFADLQRG